MIGIIGAMEEEVNAILDKCEINQEKQILDCHFYEGKVFDKDIVVLQGGIGKVNAAICTSILISEYHPNFIINIGSAGGLQSNQNVGDVVISREVAYHDVDVTAFGRQIGEIPGMPAVFKADSILVDKAKTILNEMNITYHHGLIVSGDQFIHQKVQVDEIKNFLMHFVVKWNQLLLHKLVINTKFRLLLHVHYLMYLVKAIRLFNLMSI